MKLNCRISGLPVIHAAHFGRLWREYQTEHPVFRLPTDRLWKLAQSSAATDFQWRKLSGEEQKLLFLALLNQSALMHWHSPAMPSVSLVNALFPRVYQFCAWKQHLLRPTKFPHFSVTADSASLESLGSWLEECENIRLSEFNSLTARDKERKQAEIDEKFSLLQKQSTLSKGAKTRYLNKLSAWAIEEANVPVTERTVNSLTKKELSLRELVHQILLVDAEDVHKVHEDDIDYLRDFFATALPVGSISSFALQERLKEIKTLKQAMLNQYQILDMFLPLTADEQQSLGASGAVHVAPSGNAASSASSETSHADSSQQNTIPPGSVSAHTVVSSAEPRREQFATAFAYHYALADWRKKIALTLTTGSTAR